VIDRAGAVRRLAVDQGGPAGVDVDDRHLVARGDPGARETEIRTVHELHAEHVGIELHRSVEVVGLDRHMEQAGDLHGTLTLSRKKNAARNRSARRRSYQREKPVAAGFTAWPSRRDRSDRRSSTRAA